MAIASGTRLGPYEIRSLLGSGGMGEVYRARDTQLGRDVAVKLLLEHVASDPDRIARFAREAQVLASLNHPNIAQIYGVESAGGTRALVMELVEGLTLADRIAGGPLPLAEGLPIARQIADALACAHESGIVHRDLKPANVKLRPDGTVKVLDFGLAKPIEPAIRTSAGSTAPTIALEPTQAGLILGTPFYMSPEQACGSGSDRRADLWSFGVVLFEMLAGVQPFRGETPAHVLAAVLSNEPDWARLPAGTPPSIGRLLRRCLEKDRKRRLDSAAVARLEIEEALQLLSSASAASRAERDPAAKRVAIAKGLALVAGAALVVALVTLAGSMLLRPPHSPPRPASRFVITPPIDQPLRIAPFDRAIALSQDGRFLMYGTAASIPGAGGPLVIRPLDVLDFRRIGGTDTARQAFFSPDGRWVGYFDGSHLDKVSISGGAKITLCSFAGAPRGASWGEDGRIVFASSDPATGLQEVPAEGGEPMALTAPEKDGGDHVFPTLLPGGRGVLFTITAAGRGDSPRIAVLDLESSRIEVLVRDGSQAEYVDTGHLIYAAAGTLFAVAFDASNIEVIGDPVPMVEDVLMLPNGAASYAVSRTGTLAYLQARSVPSDRTLVWRDRTGNEEPIAAPPRAYTTPRLSPDGSQVVIASRDLEHDLWMWDFGRGSLRRLTHGPDRELSPVWMPDGSRIVYTSDRDGSQNLYLQGADGSGSAEPITTGVSAKFPTCITPDGGSVIGFMDGPTSYDIVWFPLAAPLRALESGEEDSPATPLVRTASIEHNAVLSPDGRFFAYQSDQSGRFEVYVRPFPDADAGLWQISTAGGTRPIWSRDGRELFFIDGANSLYAVRVETPGDAFAWSAPERLFEMHQPLFRTAPERHYDVAPDGRRFLMVEESVAADGSAPGIVVVLDWAEELRKEVPSDG
jgi:serine/threonine-protein kinase